MPRLLFIFLILFSLKGLSQQRCSTDEKLQQLISEHPDILNKRQAIEQSMETWRNENGSNKSAEVVTIPVVVHVVYRTAAQNISTEQILSQIDVLNADYRRLNTDANNTPSEFQGIAADVELEFCLASEDPNGNWTSGITRTETDVVSWNGSDNVKFTSMGGHDNWNPIKYLNIWVCNIGSGLLGYAYPPGVPNNLDGVVIGYRYFGTVGSVSSTYSEGRTTTHEVGHWLNLYHLWGTNNNNPNCSEDDEVNDTPMQDGPNYDCPSFPVLSSACSNGPDGDVFMNFMDYVDDPCMNMFTAGQKERMLATLNTARASVKNAIACNVVGVDEKDNSQIRVYPNPASKELTIAGIDKPVRLKLLSVFGQVIEEQKVAEGTTLNLSNYATGIYVLQLFDGEEILQQEKIIIAR